MRTKAASRIADAMLARMAHSLKVGSRWMSSEPAVPLFMFREKTVSVTGHLAHAPNTTPMMAVSSNSVRTRN
jgi:hypothetical protein